MTVLMAFECVSYYMQFVDRCLPMFCDGGPLKVPVHQVYPLDQAGQAHATMRTNKNIGKLILEIL